MSQISSQSESQEITEWGDNFKPVILSDAIFHTSDHPFCLRPTCPCHDDDQIEKVALAYRDGILTYEHYLEIARGIMPW